LPNASHSEIGVQSDKGDTPFGYAELRFG